MKVAQFKYFRMQPVALYNKKVAKSTIEQKAAKMGVSVAELRSLACKVFGAIGGKNGTGASKVRSPEHYRKMVERRNEQRRQKALEDHHENNTNGTETPTRKTRTRRQRATGGR